MIGTPTIVIYCDGCGMSDAIQVDLDGGCLGELIAQTLDDWGWRQWPHGEFCPRCAEI